MSAGKICSACSKYVIDEDNKLLRLAFENDEGAFCDALCHQAFIINKNIDLALNALAAHCWEEAKNNGWDGQTEEDRIKKVLLMHEEVAELSNAIRKNLDKDDKIPEYSAQGAECADIIIRVLDFCGRFGIDNIGEIIMAKIEFNRKRTDGNTKNF